MSYSRLQRSTWHAAVVESIEHRKRIESAISRWPATVEVDVHEAEPEQLATFTVTLTCMTDDNIKRLCAALEASEP